MTDTTSRNLIIAARSGDDRAIGSLYNLHRPKGLSIARQYVRTPEDAEDMYQDSFLKAMEHLDTFDESKDFGPWLHTIIVNTCKNWLVKKRATNFSDMSDDESEFVDTLDSKDESIVPDLSYDRKEFMKIMGEIIDQLPQAQKEAVTLFYYKEMSVKDIARYQNVPEDTVKSRLNYSRKKVGTAVEEYERRTGTKLHGILLVPLLALFFKTSVNAAETGSVVASVATSAAAGAAAAQGAGAVVARGAGAAVAQGVGAGAKSAAADKAKGYAKKKVASLAIKLTAGLIGAGTTFGAVHAVTTSHKSDNIELVGSVSAPDELDGAILKRLKKKTEEELKGYISNNTGEGKKFRASDPLYEGLVVMNPKNPEENTNRVILVYSIDWYPNEDNINYTEVRGYYPISFYGVDIYGNGDIDYHEMKEDYSRSDIVPEIALRGYSDPNNMYTLLVRDQSENYTANRNSALRRLTSD